MTTPRIAVVGASLAGINAAQALRRAGHEGDLVMVGDEPHLPYDRPPLSKDYLAGTTPLDRLRLRAAADPDALGIDWRLGTGARGLVLDGGGGGSLELADGDRVDFDGLVIATGARARSLPGADGVAGVHRLRTVDDADALRADLEQRPERIVVVGAGFIGAEVAATARQAGLEVTMVEAAEAPLARVLDIEAGLAIAELHRSHGVDVRLGASVAGFEASDGRLEAVALSDGTSIQASVAVVGIGVIPNTDWVEGSGLTVDDGIVADATCLAAPGVVVAGDVARWPNERFGGRLMRVEQWDNAVEMGGYAGRRLVADPVADVEPFAPVPWFWSDQYDRKIQLAGVPTGRSRVVQGTIAERRFVQIYLDDDDRLAGALCWNRPRQAIQARQLVAAGASAADAASQLG